MKLVTFIFTFVYTFVISEADIFDVTTIIRYETSYKKGIQSNRSLPVIMDSYTITVHAMNNARGLPILLEDGSVISSNVGIDVEQCSPYLSICDWETKNMALVNSNTVPLFLPEKSGKKKFSKKTPFFPINTSFKFNFITKAQYGVLGIFLTKGLDKSYKKDMYYIYLRNGHETGFLLKCGSTFTRTSYQLPSNLGDVSCSILDTIDLANDYWNEVEQYTFKVKFLKGLISLQVEANGREILNKEYKDEDPIPVDHFNMGTIDMTGEFTMFHGNVWALTGTEGSLSSSYFTPSYHRICITTTFFKDQDSKIELKLISNKGDITDFSNIHSIDMKYGWKTKTYIAELPDRSPEALVLVRVIAESSKTDGTGLLIQRIAGCNGRGIEDTLVISERNFLHLPKSGYDIAVDTGITKKDSGMPMLTTEHHSKELTTEFFSTEAYWHTKSQEYDDSTEYGTTDISTTSDYDNEVESIYGLEGSETALASRISHKGAEFCMNDGIFIKEEGICLCPAGFIGSACEKGCGVNKYGSKCDGRCSKTTRGCKAMKLCRPKLGCNCAPGLQGNYCEKECDRGWHGIGCREVCGSCANSESCNPYTGVCLHGCIEGYYRPYCKDKYSYTVLAPQVYHAGYKTATLTANLHRDKIKGKGSPRSYQFQYKVKSNSRWLDLEPQGMIYNTVEAVISGLAPGMSYEARVTLIDEDGGSYKGEDIPVLEFETKCSVPDDVEYDIQVTSVKEDGFVIIWNYSSLGQKICQVTHYEVELNEDWRWSVHYKGLNTTDEFTDLLPGQDYEVRVRAITIGGPIKYSDILKIHTNDQGPENVQDLKLVSTNYDELKVEWTPPLDTAGIIRYYSVSYECRKLLACLEEDCSMSAGEFDVTETSAEIKHLLPHAQYAISVAAVAGSRGPDTELLAVTDMTEPEVRPDLRSKSVTDQTNVSFTVHWNRPRNCSHFNGYFYGYRYELLEEDSTEVIKKNTTLKTLATFTDLQQHTHYTVNIYVETSGGWNHDYPLQITAKTRPTVPGPVQQLTVYKKTREMLGLRWAMPKDMYGTLTSFTITSTAKGESFSSTVEPTICETWPNLYCYSFGTNFSETEHIIMVQAKNNKIDEDGEPAVVHAFTKESAPDPPSKLDVVSQTQTSLDIEWGIPDVLNGRLRSFLISVQQTDAHDIDKCCDGPPVYELEVDKEQAIYSYQVKDLYPASTYTISVSAKTVVPGNSLYILGYTTPEVPQMDGMFEILGNLYAMSRTPNVILQPSTKNEDLIRGYLLLVIPMSSEASYMQSSIWNEFLMKELKEHFNESFYIAKEFEQVDLQENFKVQIGTGTEMTPGKWGEVQDPEFQTFAEYQLALVIVLEYNGAYSVGITKSKPFLISDS